MRNRFEHAAPAGSSVSFGMAEAIHRKLPVWVKSRGDAQFPNPLIIPPSGKIICYLDADKAYDIKVIDLDGRPTEIEDPALEMVQCGCISKDMFEAMQAEQDAQADKLSDVLDALGAAQKRIDDVSKRLQALEDRKPEDLSGILERLEALEDRGSESFDEFLKSERDGRDSDSETLEGLREELQMLMNRTQAEDATGREHARYAELTRWESHILKG